MKLTEVYNKVYVVKEYDELIEDRADPVCEFYVVFESKEDYGLVFNIIKFLYGEELTICNNNKFSISEDSMKEMLFFKMEELGTKKEYPEYFL